MAPATHLSGYLKKEGKKQSLLVRTQKRFFRVEEIAPQRGDEPRLALCYYRREADAEPRGWLFLGDVEAVRDAGPALFVVEHPSRSYVLHASDAAGKKTWVEGLQRLVDDERKSGGKAPAAPQREKPVGGAEDEYRSLYEDADGDDLYDFDDGAKSREKRRDDHQDSLDEPRHKSREKRREKRRDDQDDEPRRGERRERRRDDNDLDGTRYSDRRHDGESLDSTRYSDRERRERERRRAPELGLAASPNRGRHDRYDDDADDLDALNAEMDDILYDREPPKRDKPRRDRPQRDAYDFVPPKRGHDDDQDELDSPPRRRDRDDRRRDDDRERRRDDERDDRRRDDERDRRDRRDDRERDRDRRRDDRADDRDRRDHRRDDDRDRRDRDDDPTPRQRKERKSTTPIASPLFDDEIDLGTEIVRPALDESDDRFEAKRFAPSPKAAPSPAKTPEVTKKAATPEAAPAPVQQAPPSAPTKSKTPVRIARRGVGGDELAIDWNDDKPKKKPPSALARRLARGERPAKAKSKSKRAPKEAPPPADTPLAADDHEESTEDVIATLAKERERLARKASVQGARDEAEKAAKKKAKEEKRRRKAEKKARKEKAAAPNDEIKSLFANAIKPDANFVEDDWDASPAKPAPRASGPIGGFGAVKPDSNFVEDDWDAE